MGSENEKKKKRKKDSKLFLSRAYPNEEPAALVVYSIPPRLAQCRVQMWFRCGFLGMLLPPCRRGLPLQAAVGEEGPGIAWGAGVGCVNGEFTRVRRVTQIHGGAPAESSSLLLARRFTCCGAGNVLHKQPVEGLSH